MSVTLTSEQQQLVNSLEDIYLLLQKTQSNLRKCPKQRLTRGYIETKLQTIEGYWRTFNTTHQDLVKCTPKCKRNDLSYFANEDYFVAEDLYSCLLGDLKDTLSMLSKSTDNQMQACDASSPPPRVNLPRIELPTFNGSYDDWPMFRDMFTSLVHNNTSLCNVERLHYLKLSLVGEPKELLKHVNITDINYEQAWNTLSQRYGNKRLIVHSLLQKLFTQKKITTPSAAQIKSLLDTTSQCLNNLKNQEIPVESWDQLIIYTVVQKLDVDTHTAWEQDSYKEKTDDLPSWEELKAFLETKYRTLEMVNPTAKREQTNVKAKSFHSTSPEEKTATTPTKSCSMCNAEHSFPVSECDVSSHTTLLDYLRLYIGLHGTKYMCREGGCGACIVSVNRPSATPYAVNACMMSIASCHGLEVTTIEGLGNRQKGYHELQATLANENGSQCGYCSPAWVMAMYGLLQGNPNITMLEVEQSLGSNVCRCTGYRPIMDAFKKFASDAPRQIKLQDIEDLQICEKTGEACDKSNCEDNEWCFVDQEVGKGQIIEIKLKDNRLWVKVQEVKDIFTILEREGDDSYMLVSGNTARGVYPIDEYPCVLIDICGVKELKGYTIDQNLIVNAGTTLTEFLKILQTVAEEENFGYLKKIYKHMLNVAHIPIRNVASIAGNLVIKNKHHWFPSDIFLLLEMVGAQVTIQNRLSGKRTLTMQQFLKVNLRGNVIWNVMLPPLCNDDHVVTFKVMPRSQSASALINAAFLYKLDSNKVVKCARIVFGALSPSFIRACSTEQFLVGKKLFTNETLTSALKILEEELVIEENPPAPSVEYRRKSALGLFYKGLLTLAPETKLHSRYKSGAIVLSDIRPVSRAVQVFETNQTVWPVSQPIPKREALIQCAGEACYTEDQLLHPDEVFCALALSTVASGDIVSIDASEALACPGVIAFYTAKDIPGINSFTPPDSIIYDANEPVLASTAVKFFNQAIGIIVAETRHTADRAAKLVKATYTNIRKPLLELKEAKTVPSQTAIFIEVAATDRGTDVDRVINGMNSINGQYTFMLETLTTVVRPSDEGLDVYCATQWMEGAQLQISRALGLDQNRVDVHIRLVGGGFGIKLSRCIQGAIAASLVVQKLNRPCRIVQSLTTNTRVIGKRLPCISEFEAGVNNSGMIQYINYSIYQNAGFMINGHLINLLSLGQYNNAYNRARFSYKSIDCITDTAKNTWVRAPGTLEHVAMSELVMEQISYQMDLDPLNVRLANLDPAYASDVKEMLDNVIIKSDYIKRRDFVNKFNAENRWKKRGLRFTVLRWTPIGGLNLYVNLSVYRGDGSIAITHGGIEMGQGINTKAAQVAAYLLNIPIEKIVIKGNNTVIAPNCSLSGGSVVNQDVIVGVRRACQQLLDRLRPIREQMDNPTWEELITKAHLDNVDLQTHGYTRTDEEYTFVVYGVTLAEVELDVLTGQFELLRVDLCEDVGQSVSPEIDIGQVEGAFIMGLGYWTCENLVYAPTGELLTDRTWNYYVPLARDIPQDWRVYFRKNSYSADLIFGTKCIGEPPICMAVAVPFAIREAITAARMDSGIPKTQWFQEDGPYTVERNALLMSTNTDDFKFN